MYKLLNVRKSIVFKTNSFPNISETFIVSNIIEAIKKGYEVKIIVDIINSNTNTSQLGLIQEYKLMDKVSQMKHPVRKIERKIKAMCLLLNPLLFYFFIKFCFYKGKKSLDYLFVLNFYLKFRKVKVFHVHFATAIDPLFELKEIGFLKSKIIVTFHGYDAHFLPEGNLLENLIYNFDKWISHITVNSKFLKNKLIEKGFTAENIKIIPIGVDTEFFKKDTENDVKKKVFKIITVGRFIELKGQLFGIKAVKLLKEKGCNIYYTLVGIGEELDSLKQLVIELNLEDTVHFYGLGNQSEIKELLKENDLFLMTSTRDKFDRCEAFGVVSLEAQAVGLPVVGFKVGGFPETIIESKTGITVKDKDIETLAEVIAELLLDNERFIEMTKEAKKHVNENFEINTVISEYFNLYS